MMFRLIQWPEVQDLMELEGFKENSSLASPIFGSSAYFVDEEWLKKVKGEGNSIIRVAVLDHARGFLYVEDILKSILDKCYEGKIENYIVENYGSDNYNWQCIVEAVYFPAENKDPIDIDFKNLS